MMMTLPRLRSITWWACAFAALPALAHAQWESKNVGGVDVRIYTPTSMSPTGSGRALMVVLHGCSQTADQLRDNGNFEPAADEYGVVIALPNVPLGGVIAGCWDYYDAFHSRTSKHTGPVVNMTEALRDDPTYGIDPDQMYMVGFSSGGGQALILGCVAPDLYAGVGAVAAPGLGSSLNQIGSPGTTGMQAAALCQQFAAGYAADLESQVGIVFNDANDFTVSQQYGAINTEMFGIVMSDGIDAMSSTDFDMASLPGTSPSGTGTIYADAIGDRVVRLQSMGVSHAWPSGSGSGGGGLTFVAANGLNFSLYAAEFFAMHNVRTGGWDPPGGGDDGGGSGDGGMGSDGGGDEGGATSGGDAGTGDAGSGDATAGDDGGGIGPLGQDPVGGYVEPSGCQCRSAPDRRLPWGWLAAFGLVLGWRRRR